MSQPGKAAAASRSSVGTPLLLVDSDDQAVTDRVLASRGEAVAANWARRADPRCDFAIPSCVDSGWEELQREYLAWVSSLGMTRACGDGDVNSYFKLPGLDLSLWSCSVIREKSSFKSASLSKILKLRALEKLYLGQGCRGIRYIGCDATLAKVLSGWCSRLGHPFEWVKAGTHSADPIERRPRWLSAAANARTWLKHFRLARRHAPVRRVDGEPLKGATVVTYFPNFDQKAAQEGRFRSRYWEDLHSVFDCAPFPINWVFIYAESVQHSYADVLALRDRFNAEAEHKQTNQRYYLIEEFLAPQSLGRILKRFAWSFRQHFRLRSIRDAFRFPGSELNFFEIAQIDWDRSFAGDVAMDNLFWIEAFEGMASRLEAHPWGLYLWENQGWESALIRAWKKHGVQRIIAYAHSTLRPFDPRSFTDRADYAKPERAGILLPDRLAVNGRFAWSLMERNGFPASRLDLVESIRYPYLAGRFASLQQPPKSFGRTLLAVTGIVETEARFQLGLLGKLLRDGDPALERYSRIMIKPHPFLDIALILEDEKISSRVELTHRPLPELWAEVDFVYCSNLTSVSVEAAWMGIRQSCAGSHDLINISPLFGIPGAVFVDSPEQLARTLESPPEVQLPEDFFHFDKELSGWKALLK